MTRPFQSLWFVSKQSETTKLLITLTKMAIVSSFHRFRRVLAGNFKLEPDNHSEIKLGPFPENDETTSLLR
jgi:hypothetical protein